MSTIALVDNPDAVPEPFHLPMDGLFADLDLGEGSICLPDEFLQSAGMLQVEILQDWQRALENCRRRALARMFREATAEISHLPVTEKVTRFRLACKEAGIECPPDLPVLLQQY